jgi:hypothetical protein
MGESSQASTSQNCKPNFSSKMQASTSKTVIEGPTESIASSSSTSTNETMSSIPRAVSETVSEQELLRRRGLEKCTRADPSID